MENIRILIVIFSICSVVASFIFYRFRKNPNVAIFWTPLFTIALVWTISAATFPSPAIPLFIINAQFVILFIGLLIAFPRKEAWIQKNIFGGLAATLLIFAVGHFVFSSSVDLKVRDQQDKPVANSSIKYTLRTENIFFPFKRVKGKLRSDSQGNATIRYYFFQQLILNTASKPGYVLSIEHNLRIFPAKWSYPKPPRQQGSADQTTPVPIGAQKIDPNVRILTGQGSIHPVQDGRKYTISIPTPGENITLRISVTPDPNGNSPVGDWSFALELPQGGLQLTDTEMVFAKEDGYQTSIKKKLVKGKRGWARGHLATYYFKTSKKIYGKFSIRIVSGAIGNNRALVNYHYWINDGGGRSLASSSTRFVGYPNRQSGK